MTKILPIILAGGVGSRLWPASRALYPKQFLPLADDKHSLLQQTLQRLPLKDKTMLDPVVICQFEHRFLVADQLEALGLLAQAVIILEPQGKNTAPAVITAALHAKAAYPEEKVQLLILPADHAIEDTAYFQERLWQAATYAEADWLVTFGIQPRSPETGYGYIEQGAPLGHAAFKTAQFIEKPDAEKAQQLLDAGGFLWNSGMFLFPVDLLLQEARQFFGEGMTFIEAAYAKKTKNLIFWVLAEEAFSKVPAISVDYAIMEKTDRAAVIPYDARWSDLGSWESLAQTKAQDGEGNYWQGDVFVRDCTNCAIFAGERLVTAMGLKDCIVVETADAVLVADRAQVQAVKDLVADLKAGDREEYKLHRQVFRPWGSYETLQKKNGYSVKRLVVKSQQAISLQRHQHRSEHWVVVHGEAEITCEDKVFILKANESTYIPKRAIHRLSNHGKMPVEIIEVQVGDYLEEDDIERFNDAYGR